MKKSYLIFLIGILGILIVNPAEAGNKHYTLVDGEKDFYYGFISYLPDEPGSRLPEVIRPDLARPEVVSLNFPLGPGDVILTFDKSCEIQFDSGTIVRLGPNTRLRIETIMAQSLSASDQLSNLFLEKGDVYVMYTAYSFREVFQLLTPNAALKMKNKTVLLVSVTDDGETRLTVRNGKVNLLFGASSKDLKSLSIKKGGSLLVGTNHQVDIREGFSEFGEFAGWNEELNKNFLDLHKGITPIPAPVQKLPPAVFHFAQFYSSIYGEWIWDSYLGYVWRPYYNDVSPWGSWSPYFYGRWTYLNDQLFWVAEEPWGWVPYHLGVWYWDENKGWLWIPGSAFAPAWASWDFYLGHYIWRPWLLYDWLGLYGYDYYGYQTYYFSHDYYLGPPQDQEGRKILKKITKDQMKKTPTPPIPKDYKKIVTNLAKAINRGDEEVLQKVAVKPPEPMIVRAEDIGAPNVAQKRVPTSEILKRLKQAEISPDQINSDKRISSPLNRATWLFFRSQNRVEISQPIKTDSKLLRTTSGSQQVIQPAELPSGAKVQGREPATKPERPVSKSPDSSGLRFRDWNPDLKTARQLGLRIVYDSSRNSVVAPEIGLTSREAKEMGLRISPRGLVRQLPSSSAGSSASSFSSSSSISSSGSSGSFPDGPGPLSGSSKGGSLGGKAASSVKEKH